MNKHIDEVIYVTFVEESSGWNGRWKNINKKSLNIILVPSQRYQDSRHLLQNPKVPRNVSPLPEYKSLLHPDKHFDSQDLEMTSKNGAKFCGRSKLCRKKQSWKLLALQQSLLKLSNCPGNSCWIQSRAVQWGALQCCALQSAVQCSAVQCSEVQCSAVQSSEVHCSAVQCSAFHKQDTEVHTRCHTG